MKIGFGTYGMQSLDIFDILPRIKKIGYEAVEINVGDEWPTAPHKLDSETRKRLVEALKTEEFPPPVLMIGLPICVRGETRPAMLKKLDAISTLAQNLNFREDPAVIVSTLGGVQDSWDKEKNWICESLLELADRTARTNVILGIEPHVGHIFDTPEKAVWVMEQTGHPYLKLNFDISHFHVLDIDLQHSVDLCAPFTAATHIKDGQIIDEKVQFLLPGQGDLDLTTYIHAVAIAGINVPITVEISAQLWKASDYNPWQAAESSFQALDQARNNANSPL